LFLDDEIEVVIVRPDSSRRHNTYPFALLVAGANRRTVLSISAI